MSYDIAIKVENISKCFTIYQNPQDRLKQSIYPRLQRFLKIQSKQYYREFWALKDISFEIKKGETVGIIGRNGSGKSTLLQIVCGTLSPTSGILHTNGRIAALLELGSGFNPEFTGRENVYMGSAILGLSQTEIESRLDNILGFADIGDFIDQPVKTYSSGMYVRLAFAVNIMSNPEIMVIDEALAVGDMNFQAKCMTALKQIQDTGTTVLFVSHDIGSLKSLCMRGIYLERGVVKMIGSAAKVSDKYLKVSREEFNQENNLKLNITDPSQDILTSNQIESGNGFKVNKKLLNPKLLSRYGNGEAKITNIEILNVDNEPIKYVEFNEHVKIRIYFESYTNKDVTVNFIIFDEKKIQITGCGFLLANQKLLKIEPEGQYLVEYSLSLPLQHGNYSIQAQISKPVNQNVSSVFLDVVDDFVTFQMNKREKVLIWSKVHLFPKLQIKKMTSISQKRHHSSKKIAFIIGTGRCGTTMLARMLNAHSKLCVPPEMQIIFEHSNNGERLNEVFSSGKNLEWHANDFIEMFQKTCPYKFQVFFDYEHFFHQLNYPIKDLRTLLNNLFQKIAIAKGKEFFIEQTPWYGQRIDLLKKNFPNAKFIHMVRDGRDVALSFSKTPWWFESPLDNLEQWQKEITKIRQDAKIHLSNNQYLEVKYEEIVTEPENYLSRIIEFLGFQYESNMLNSKNYIDYSTFKEGFDNSINSEEYQAWRGKKEKAVFPDNINRWKKANQKLFLSMSEQSRKTLKEFGYEIK